MSDNESATIESGSQVLMYFSLALEDGTIADCTDDGEPMRFTMGDGTLIKGLELALYGLKAGDHQSLVVGPDVGFGFRDDEAIQVLPRSDFPADMELEPGLIIGFSTPSGEEVPGAIVDIEGDDVHVDFNHPLAGHNVRFDVEILEVTPPAAD
jgi:FKBP-type peptidyl-prolyl cis-trans isomerase SlpA